MVDFLKNYHYCQVDNQMGFKIMEVPYSIKCLDWHRYELKYFSMTQLRELINYSIPIGVSTIEVAKLLLESKKNMLANQITKLSEGFSDDWSMKHQIHSHESKTLIFFKNKKDMLYLKLFMI